MRARGGILAAALLGACSSSGGEGQDDYGEWLPMTETEAPAGVVDHTAEWTGTQMIVWGGENMFDPENAGSRYDPAADRWRATSLSGVPQARDDHASVWTGSELIVWAGNWRDEDTDLLDSGGRYDPIADTWRAVASSPLTARDDPQAVWTGTEMIVWGGRDPDGHVGNGARYRPDTDSWQLVSMVGAPPPREDHSAIWTGAEMIIWGGWNGSGAARNYQARGGRYDPVTDTWRAVNMAGAPSPREDHAAIWTGSEMVIWGGMIYESSSQVARQLDSGAAYDPASDTWRPVSVAGAPEAREEQVAVWSGTEMLVWGGQHNGVFLQSGARWSPDTDTWTPMATVGAPTARVDHVAVWTGEAMIVWGGNDGAPDYTSSGGIYIP